MLIHFAAMGILALLIAIGLFYRLASLLFFLSFTYVFLLDKAYYLNHFYLIALLSFLLAVVPAHRAFSLDRRLHFASRPEEVPQWSVLLLRAQVFIVYFYAGLAKLNADWLRGEPIRMWLAERTEFPIVGTYFTSEWMVFLVAYGGLLFDLSIGFLLLWRRTRLPAFGLTALFHLMNANLFSIGIFPYLAMAATSIFAEPDWPRPMLAKLRVWLSAGRFQGDPQLPSRSAPAVMQAGPEPFKTALILALAHIYLLSQLLIPLRHFLYPGNVSWTEEGHRFSWHMKLRDKEAELHIYLTDPRTGASWEVSPAVDLSAKQLDEMRTRPGMILQYVHHLADRMSMAGQPRPIIRVDHWVSLNGRPYQRMIDPHVDLVGVRPSDGASVWILPLTTHLGDPSHAVGP